MASPNIAPVAPNSVCILRLSALGDVCHTLAVVRTLQRAWPACRFTWIIGKVEAKLLGHLPDIEFIVFDKRAGLQAYRDVRKHLTHRRFDVLLHMQVALRASLLATLIPATLKLGFDKARAREFQWLFTHRGITARKHQHVLDGLMGFAEYFRIAIQPPSWDIPLPMESLEYASHAIPNGQRTLLISPCSSHSLRNWSAERYAAIGDHAVERHRMAVLVCGGRSDMEMAMGKRIAELMRHPCQNLVGKDTLPQLLATLKRATVLLSPDSGPAHMATMVGTPVIGLYAATRLARCGPYLSRQWCTDKFDDAARLLLNTDPSNIPWTKKIEVSGVMNLIEVDEVKAILDRLMSTLFPQENVDQRPAPIQV